MDASKRRTHTGFQRATDSLELVDDTHGVGAGPIKLVDERDAGHVVAALESTTTTHTHTHTHTPAKEREVTNVLKQLCVQRHCHARFLPLHLTVHG
jgi:hypothetical protein